LDDPDWDASDWDSDYSIKYFPTVRPNAPKYLFSGSRDFAKRHGNGTKAEFKLEAAAIKSFNRKLRVFYAWPVVILGSDPSHSIWLFLVQTGADDSMLPKEGETCLLKIPRATRDGVKIESGEDGKKFAIDTTFDSNPASRVDNPCSEWGIKDDFWQRTMAFEVTLPTKKDPTKEYPTQEVPFKPIIDAETAEKGFKRIPKPKGSDLKVAFELRLSFSTSAAELNALDKFEKAMETQPSSLSSEMRRRRLAFEYLMRFQPESYTSLFDTYPHLRTPFLSPEKAPKELVRMLRDMNQHQKEAYEGLSRIPNRVCFVPGGPGAG
jgi:hypothetical protein